MHSAFVRQAAQAVGSGTAPRSSSRRGQASRNRLRTRADRRLLLDQLDVGETEHDRLHEMADSPRRAGLAPATPCRGRRARRVALVVLQELAEQLRGVVVAAGRQMPLGIREQIVDASSARSTRASGSAPLLAIHLTHPEQRREIVERHPVLDIDHSQDREDHGGDDRGPDELHPDVRHNGRTRIGARRALAALRAHAPGQHGEQRDPPDQEIDRDRR